MKPIKSYMYTPQEIQLAHELADALDDRASLTFYLACTKKYSHRALREKLTRTLSIPKEKIRTSRGALFNHLVGQLPEREQDDYADYDNPWN